MSGPGSDGYRSTEMSLVKRFPSGVHSVSISAEMSKRDEPKGTAGALVVATSEMGAYTKRGVHIISLRTSSVEGSSTSTSLGLPTS